MVYLTYAYSEPNIFIFDLVAPSSGCYLNVSVCTSWFGPFVKYVLFYSNRMVQQFGRIQKSIEIIALSYTYFCYNLKLNSLLAKYVDK